ncbi:universal stress protein [Persicobacter psychrovividus]|uniref:UspA domain-containing protein n=1 Tax=Persicobacter psychrovividus TaxID=387638 RepID=A0ABM7VIV9_9BACT|nr:hypothetical protein PEPS_31940 [Persicobacter psychrovividus]
MNISKLNIIAATNFTPASEHAYQFAKHMMATQEAHFTLLHAYQAVSPTTTLTASPTPIVPPEHYEKDLKQRLHQEAERLRLDPKESTYFDCGSLAEVIKRYEEVTKPDLVVLGAREKGTVERMMTNTHTLSLLEEIDTPILSIPKEATQPIISKITLVAEDQEMLTPERLNKLKAIFGTHMPQVALVCVEEVSKTKLVEAGLDIQYYTKPVAPTQVLDTVEESPFDTAKEQILRSKPDLIVTLLKTPNFAEKIFKNSLMDKLIYQDNLPIILM